MNRRKFLKLAGTAAAASSLGINIVRAQESRSLRVGVYGGYFQDSFDEHIFPRFTEDTGIAVESIGVPTGEAWLVQLEAAARANQAPADVSMMAQTPRLRGVNSGLWAALDESAMPNLQYLREPFVQRDAEGQLVGVGALSWYVTLVTNTDVYPEAPESWAAFWDPANANSLGLLALPSNSFLLEITAATFFPGEDMFVSEERITELLSTLQGLRDNVQLWYRDEGQFQQALQSGEIPMGQYYHDVTGIAAAEGFPVRSTFPQEGGVLDSGSWAVSRASDRLEEAQVFIDYMCQPEVQDLVARRVGTAPSVEREFLGLDDAEFAEVSSDISPILPHYPTYLERSDWLDQRWLEMIIG